MVTIEKPDARKYRTTIFTRADERAFLERAAILADRSVPDFMRHAAMQVATEMVERNERG